MLIQENKMLIHTSKYQDQIFYLYDIMQLLWPRNCPNINMIEFYWIWMQQTIMKKVYIKLIIIEKSDGKKLGTN